jgi:hypothetical protein
MPTRALLASNTRQFDVVVTQSLKFESNVPYILFQITLYPFRSFVC